jgi:tetratricopeptide (TPR) repeat protein
MASGKRAPHLALADLLLQQSNSGGALEELKTAANLSPIRSATRLQYAEFKAKIGAADDAKAILKEITRQAPGYLPAWGCLAKFAYTEKKYDESLSFLENIFNREIRVSPVSAQSYLGLGVILREQGKTAEARTTFEKVQELEPQNQVALQHLVELDILSQDFNSASRRVARQSEEAPRSANAHFLEGKLHAAQGEWDRAETALLKTFELDPRYSAAYDLLISTYIASNKLTQAIDKLNTLLSKDPNNVRLLMLSGLINDKLKQPQPARDAYEKLLSVRPDFAPALKQSSLSVCRSVESARQGIRPSPASEGGRCL